MYIIKSRGSATRSPHLPKITLELQVRRQPSKAFSSSLNPFMGSRNQPP